MATSKTPRTDGTTSGFGLTQPRPHHAGRCGWRTRCWRAECRDEFGIYNTIEVLTDEIVA